VKLIAKRARCYAAIDTATYVRPAVAALLYVSGVRTIFRYLNRERDARKVPDLDDPNGLVSCSTQELYELCAIGFTVIPVGGWFINAVGRPAGYICGNSAAWNAQQVGFPEGISMACDWEYSSNEAAQPPEEALNYVRGYVSGAYDQAPTIKPFLYHANDIPGLGGAEICGLPVPAYWQGAAVTPILPHRGPQVIQCTEGADHKSGNPEWQRCIKVLGMPLDHNIIRLDRNYYKDAIKGAAAEQPDPKALAEGMRLAAMEMMASSVELEVGRKVLEYAGWRL